MFHGRFTQPRHPEHEMWKHTRLPGDSQGTALTFGTTTKDVSQVTRASIARRTTAAHGRRINMADTPEPLPAVDVYDELERLASIWGIQVNRGQRDATHDAEFIDAFGQLARLACSAVLR